MKKTELIVIADESGSMFSVREDANGAFNAYIDAQRHVAGECRLSLVYFSGAPRPAYEGKPLADVERMALNPHGNTALYDAIGETLVRQGKRIADEKWAELVVVVILTDGQENSSREYSLAQVREMTQHAESKGWKFIYLMANQDAFARAQQLGSSGVNTMTHAATGQGMHDAYAYASAQTQSMRTEPPKPPEPTP